MIEFLVSWAEQLIIALVVIIIIEIVLPSGNNYKKYIKVVLGIFLLYTIINPLIGKKIEFKEVTANIYEENKVLSQNVINYNEQIVKNFKTKFEENLNEFLKEKGYEITKIDQDIEYKNEDIEIKEIKMKIKKYVEDKNHIEKIEIKEPSKISKDEIATIKKNISENYKINENKIIIESENNYD